MKRERMLLEGDERECESEEVMVGMYKIIK